MPERRPGPAKARALSPDRVRRIYDRIGVLQDTQAFYEDPATSLLLRRARLFSARRVFEFGCGTGRLAARMLTDRTATGDTAAADPATGDPATGDRATGGPSAGGPSAGASSADRLPADATYCGIDLSPTMVRLARRRLEPFGDRARVDLSDGRAPADEMSSAYDRFVSTYVLDLLPDDEIRAVVGGAWRMLEAGGLLCLCSLCTGAGPASRVVARIWSAVHRLSPALVAGCRPLELTRYLPAEEWTVLSSDRVAPFAVPSEVVVAERRA